MVVGFVVVNLRPGLWFVDNTPTGGDLGAHVWGPAYLRDVLIGEWRLTGWTHDWYAGFPAFTFYMVLPALLVVIVDVGLNIREAVFAYLSVALTAGIATLAIMRRRGASTSRCWTAALLAATVFGAIKLPFSDQLWDRALAVLLLPAIAGVAVWYGWDWFGAQAARNHRSSQHFPSQHFPSQHRPLRLLVTVATPLLVLLAVPMPYGVALKLVTVAGLVTLPVAVAIMTRLAGVAIEGRILATAASLLFVFDRSFNIYGGNLMSTMAGEFAYALGLTCAVVFIGVMARGMNNGSSQVSAGVLLAITGLLHLFSAFFALGALVAFLLVSRWTVRDWHRRVGWTFAAGAIGAALSAWWVLPFWWNRHLLNDMGWGKDQRYLSALWSRSEFDYNFLINHPPLQVFVALALVSCPLLFWKRSRLGMALAVTAVMVAVAFVALPEGRLWNVRILPFYYLSVYLLAALGVGEALSSARRWLTRPRLQRLPAIEAVVPAADSESSVLPDAPIVPAVTHSAVSMGDAESPVVPVADAVNDSAAASSKADTSTAATNTAETGAAAVTGTSPRWMPMMLTGAVALLGVAAVMVTLGLPLRSLPGGSSGYDGIYRWGPFSSSETNLGTYWVEYNFEGYEDKPPTPDGGGSAEYWDLVETMQQVGETHGCGAAFWEYESGRLASYGTPMAPMLLPYWTDRCITSSEGLYFEASATVPYHFLMQSQLSMSPSRAQRDLPYSGLDVIAGVQQLRTMGMRYYMAFSPAAVAEARASDALTEIAATTLGPWVVFKVNDSSTVTPLTRLPVVVAGINESSDAWLEASVGAFLAGEDTVGVLTADGPDDWPRLTLPVASEADNDISYSGGLGGLSGDESGHRRQEVMRRLAWQLPAVVPVNEIKPVIVSNLTRDNHSISFSVDRVGAPVLIRTSYFPNWEASGAEGPYRATPNFMVVVPTDTEVHLSYGRSPVEWFATFVTLFGLAVIALLALSARSRHQRRDNAALVTGLDATLDTSALSGGGAGAVTSEPDAGLDVSSGD